MPGPLKRPHFKWAGAASSCLRGALALTPRGTLRCGCVSPTSGSPAFLLPFLDSIKTWPSVIIPYLRWYGQGQVLESESTELGTRQRELASELSPSVPPPLLLFPFIQPFSASLTLSSAFQLSAAPSGVTWVARETPTNGGAEPDLRI